ncbi:hypothetical protein QQF64_022613 [Cirrhinus molitorella]|uniref:Uncharacterized protein n=1 Tax=Cirrhinus molitorella TaxID=172907 RepID=A0ABR3L339_9TELE
MTWRRDTSTANWGMRTRCLEREAFGIAGPLRPGWRCTGCGHSHAVFGHICPAFLPPRRRQSMKQTPCWRHTLV